MRRQEINYGELVVLGTDGELPGGNKGRRRSRYTVRAHSFEIIIQIKFLTR